jgi:hypothetical protein
MTTYTTTVRRTMHGGLEAVTVIPLGSDDRILRVATHKISGGRLMTDATAVKATAGGGFMWSPFGDYNKRIAIATARATERAIEAQHAAALASIAPTVAEAIAFYAQQVAA